MLQIAENRPVPGVLFGITHDADGTVIIREPRILKVGIGLPRGRALNVWIHNDRKWKIRFGYKGEEAKTYTFENREQAEEFFHANYSKAPICNYPRKLSFFTFTRPVISDDGAELFEPDFDAIEAHGPMPTSIDIVFLDDNPFSGAYQMWSTSELRCKGDGLNAMRVLSLAATDEEKALAQEARENGEKYFPIVHGCWTFGCPYSKETVDDKGKVQPSPCKPGGDLKFQLARNIRVGGTAYFHTSGYRSISHIFSSLERIKALTGGRLAGIPLKMVLRPYRTKHNGQAATQYGVSLEFRAEDVESLRRNLIEQAFKFRAAIEPRRLLESPAELPLAEDDEEEPPISAQAMADEFYPEAAMEEAEERPSQADQPSASAASATQAKTEQLAQKLKAKTGSRAAKGESYAPEIPTEPAPGTAAPPADGDLF